MAEDIGERPSSVSQGRPGSSVFPKNPLGESFEGIATGRDLEWAVSYKHLTLPTTP